MEIYPIAIISIILAFTGLVIISKLLRLSTNILFLGIFGTLVGLLIGALVSSPLSRLPGYYGSFLPIVVTAISVFGTLVLFLSKKDLIMTTFEGFSRIFKLLTTISSKANTNQTAEEYILDTSVIIDGRILDIARTGFLPGNLVVARFVLNELQNLADSDNVMKREKGRRGLELLNNLKKKNKTRFVLVDDNFENIKEVDLKLVKLAKKRNGYLLTTDYNLNKVAKVDGVEVLNINELANAVKPVLIPGEEINVKVIQAGKEKGQGVAYLPDGTMIVVENGDELLGRQVSVKIKRIFQTDAGKMFFAVLQKETKEKLRK